MISKAQGPEDSLALLEQMMLIRDFEERCAEYYAAGFIRGFLHLYIGQEAICVGIMKCLRNQDQVFATYREHGHAIAKGVDLNRIMAELFGKITGVSRGRGGSMHIFDVSRNFYGGSAIVGGGIPMAVGMAMANKMQANGSISVCFFGEGAIAEGEFHEAMNLAALWSLPILFVCENNYYAMGTAIERSESQLDLAAKAESYHVEATSVDGMDILAVLKSAMAATNYVREFKKPFFMECRTYRFRAHSMFDPDLYRSKDEIMKWLSRDPIKMYEDFLRRKNFLDDEAFEDIKHRVDSRLKDALAFAKESPFETNDELERFVYFEGGNL